VHQAIQLLTRIAQIKESQGIESVIIAGDFNATAVRCYGYEPLAYPAMISKRYHSVYNEYYAVGRTDWWTTWKIREKEVREIHACDCVDDGFAMPALKRQEHAACLRLQGVLTEAKHSIDYIFLSEDLRSKWIRCDFDCRSLFPILTHDAFNHHSYRLA
jgi:hypothetical protein